MRIVVAPQFSPDSSSPMPTPIQETREFCKECTNDVWETVEKMKKFVDGNNLDDKASVKTDAIVDKGK